MARTIIVIPCYNEEKRLDVARCLQFLNASERVQLLLVNDGSRDDTLGVLERLRHAAPDRIQVLDLHRNGGKAEAVRQGFLEAFKASPDYVGFWDADLATPLEAIPAFEALLNERPQLEMVFGARIRLLGRSIERKAARHYLGRVFATAASMALGLAIYDTQCGAKLFRATPLIQSLFETRFLTNWVFDVEILARFIQARRSADLPPVETAIYEYPLLQWHDVAGSKIGALDFPKGAIELLIIYRTYVR